jgi:hypothetical protein
VTEADLGDGGHVDGVVEAAVAPPRLPEDLSSSRGDLDRSGAVVGGEVVTAGEAGDVADVTDDDGGDDWTDSEHVGHCRLGRLDRCGDPLSGIAQLLVETAQVGDELDRNSLAGRRHRPLGLELVEQAGGLSCADLATEPAR